MMGTSSGLVERVRGIVEPIVGDLGLDLYDLEQRGGTLRITIDTPPGSPGGVDLDKIAVATRLISRELDEHDPLPGRYTLEVTSPGVERSLRTPAHFRREIGKRIAVRLADTSAEERRLEGLLVAADDSTATLRVGSLPDGAPDDRTIDIAGVDRARTVFEWGPQPKPGGPRAGRTAGSRRQGPATPSEVVSEATDSEDQRVDHHMEERA
ncbi:MAG: ribosome maturation factor RimP [Actinomycetota bacterium]|jgi:ribosome maturation factor RimP